jgi:uncharacterized protein (DUF885 family)
MREARETISPLEGAEEMDRSARADACKVIDAHVERARQHHAQHGVWPPDALLDEVADARRRIRAEHGNDWRKVLARHVEQDEQLRQRESAAPTPDQPVKPAAA